MFGKFVKYEYLGMLGERVIWYFFDLKTLADLRYFCDLIYLECKITKNHKFFLPSNICPIGPQPRLDTDLENVESDESAVHRFFFCI